MTQVKKVPGQTDVQEEMQELSKEELAKRKAEMSAFYKDNIKHLKVQLDYEEYLTKIEKTRAERLQAQMFMVQAYAAQENQGGDEGSPTREAEMDFNAANSEG
mgnify:CR=1 FL=1|tara:strand:+ start:35385 stop:35693 length:309 start_codon:yes stop_codon:yes gene_type:complete